MPFNWINWTFMLSPNATCACAFLLFRKFLQFCLSVCAHVCVCVWNYHWNFVVFENFYGFVSAASSENRIRSNHKRWCDGGGSITTWGKITLNVKMIILWFAALNYNNVFEWKSLVVTLSKQSLHFMNKVEAMRVFNMSTFRQCLTRPSTIIFDPNLNLENANANPLALWTLKIRRIN